MPELLSGLQNYIDNQVMGYDAFPEDRKLLLQSLAAFVTTQHKKRRDAELIFICTHNSRRSHLSQIWAQVAAYYYGISGVLTYSGGTEATAFNPRAVAAIERAGFKVRQTGKARNPLYLVRYARTVKPLRCFSKVFIDPANPHTDFCAVMTCSDADEACPAVFGAIDRIPLRYDDPKAFDDTDQETAKYDERCLQIARELFYAISLVKTG